MTHQKTILKCKFWSPWSREWGAETWYVANQVMLRLLLPTRTTTETATH